MGPPIFTVVGLALGLVLLSGCLDSGSGLFERAGCQPDEPLPWTGEVMMFCNQTEETLNVSLAYGLDWQWWLEDGQDPQDPDVTRFSLDLPPGVQTRVLDLPEDGKYLGRMKANSSPSQEEAETSLSFTKGSCDPSRVGTDVYVFHRSDPDVLRIRNTAACL